MKKILLSLLAFGLISLNANAKPTLKNELETIIEDSGVNIESIAVSFKDVNNSKLVYALNDKILMNPASVQKILTTPVIAETLGENYEFKTELYTRGDKDFVIKLSADPYLSSKDLKELITPINIGTNRVFIDDSIIDNKIWGEGWQWDDDMNILMPRFNSYNLDKNLIKLTILPSDNDEFATIINPSKYPLVFFNNIKKGENTDINIHRDSSISTNTMVLTGTVARPAFTLADKNASLEARKYSATKEFIFQSVSMAMYFAIITTVFQNGGYKFLKKLTKFKNFDALKGINNIKDFTKVYDAFSKGVLTTTAEQAKQLQQTKGGMEVIKMIGSGLILTILCPLVVAKMVSPVMKLLNPNLTSKKEEDDDD